MSEQLYAFNAQDKDALLREIGAGGGEVPQFSHPGGGGGKTLFRFTLTSGWTSGSASADIKEISDGTAVESSTVEDPLTIFSDGTTGSLISGDDGLCLKQGGSYYAIQAPCGSKT